jgi:hypothetical protein
MLHCLTFSFTLYTTCFGLHGHLQVCRMFCFVFYFYFFILFSYFVTSTIKLHADGNITCKTHWTIQCSRMLKYSIIVLIGFGRLSLVDITGNAEWLNKKLFENVKRSCGVLFKVISKNSPRGTEENYWSSQTGVHIRNPRMRSRNITPSTTTLSTKAS